MMTDAMAELDGIAELIATARGGMGPEPFVAALRTHVQAIFRLVGETASPDFHDADYRLGAEIADYEREPTLAGVARLGNAAVGFRVAVVAAASARRATS